MTNFSGFSPEALKFFDQLGANNNKTWFEAHKDDFKTLIQQPAIELVTAIGQRLQTDLPDLRYDSRTNGSGSLMRIYRDVRFSEDKTPYKTAQAGMLWLGEGKKTKNPGFGFHIESSGAKLMAGIFGFDKHQLAAFRQAVDDDDLGPQLQDALREVAATGNYGVAGEHYKRVPRGFDPDHPRADLLRYNTLYIFVIDPLSPKVVTSPDLVDTIVTHFQNMAPVVKWMDAVFNK